MKKQNSKKPFNHDSAMSLAILAAETGVGKTNPNPPVGAVLIKDDVPVGFGYHEIAGGEHAEVVAIREAGKKAKGATLYVSLEPCSTAGRVGACTDAIIAAGIKKVFYAEKDPNPKNRGKAKLVLKKAGIECEQFKPKLFADLSKKLIAPFGKYITTGMPYVTVKIAMSLDGKICDDRGDSKWITSQRMRNEVGKLRSQVDAIMVGAETIRKDDPSLLPHKGSNKRLIRVVISRSGKLPKKAQVFTDGKNQTLVFPDAELALRELGKIGVMHVLCEGGLQLATSLAEAGLVDEWITVVAPKVIGSHRINDAVRVPRIEVREDSGK